MHLFLRIIAFTPGMARAAWSPMRLDTRLRGSVSEGAARTSIPGLRKSSAYRARPVTLSSEIGGFSISGPTSFRSAGHLGPPRKVSSTALEKSLLTWKYTSNDVRGLEYRLVSAHRDRDAERHGSDHRREVLGNHLMLARR